MQTQIQTVLTGSTGDDSYNWAYEEGVTIIRDEGGFDQITILNGDANNNSLWSASYEDEDGNFVIEGKDWLNATLVIENGFGSGRVEKIFWDYPAGHKWSGDHIWKESWVAHHSETFNKPAVEYIGSFDDDEIIAGSGYSSLYGNAGDDALILGADGGWARGGSGDDVIKGGDGDEHIAGGTGNDHLETGSGNDSLYGDDGDDTLRINGSGTSFLDGGNGFDTFQIDLTNYTPSFDGFIVEINLQTGKSGAVGSDGPLTDQLVNIESIEYSGFHASILTGDSLANSIRGGSGDDEIYGGAGDDILNTGSGGDDFLYGESGDDLLINSAAGSSVTIDGGDGNDTFQQDLSNFSSLSNDIIIEINLKQGISGALGYTNNQDRLISIENITHIGSYDTVLTGNDQSNIILGSFGSDEIYGGNGNDSLHGGEGDDTLSGWMGNDEIYGGRGDDVIINTGGEDLFDGGEGVDTLITDLSQTVKDELGFSNWDFDIVFDLTATDPHMRHYGLKPDGSDYAWDEIYNIENYTLIGDFDIQLIGDDRNNRLIADTGDDVLRGGLGNDYLEDGAGNDEVYGGDGDDTINNIGGTDIFDGGDGDDTLITDISTGFDERSFEVGFNTIAGTHGRLNSNVGQDTIIGIENFTLLGNFNAEVEGGDENNRFITDAGDDEIQSGAGNDYISAGLGNDIIRAGTGNDTIINLGGSDIVDGGEGIDWVITDLSQAILDRYGFDAFSFDVGLDLESGRHGRISGDFGIDQYSNIENYQLIGDFHSDLAGDSGNNVIIAGGGDDKVSGRQGDDTLQAGRGSDYLLGGTGNDSLVLDADGVWTYGAYAKNVGLNSVLGTGELISLKGYNKFSDVVDGGEDSDEIVLTNSDDAFFLHDSFSALHGSLTQISDNTTARLIDLEMISAGDGDDLIDLTSENFSLASIDMTLNGEAGDDILWAAQGDDTLNGGTGDDVLNGSSGNDTLTGSSGADIFEFTATSGNDTITDYNQGDGDVLRFYRRSADTNTPFIDEANDQVTWQANGHTVTIDFDTDITATNVTIEYELI